MSKNPLTQFAQGDAMSETAMPNSRRSRRLRGAAPARTQLRVLGASVAAGCLTFGLVAPANAATVGASDCLTGSGSRSDIVSKGNGPTMQSESILRCGNYSIGVIHIDSSHPIRENGSDDANIVRCHKKIMTYGKEIDAARYNLAFQIKRPSGGKATLVMDADSYEVVTMYTSDGSGNNWAACARFPN